MARCYAQRPARRTASPAQPYHPPAERTDRPPRYLNDNEAPDLGRKRVRWLGTPHVPHNGDAGLIHEETTGTLFSSDLFTQTDLADPLTESDLVAPPSRSPSACPSYRRRQWPRLRYAAWPR